MMTRLNVLSEGLISSLPDQINKQGRSQEVLLITFLPARLVHASVNSAAKAFRKELDSPLNDRAVAVVLNKCRSVVCSS